MCIDTIAQFSQDNVGKCIRQWSSMQFGTFQILRGFVLEVNVSAQFHPTIIGRRGATVTEIRKKYDVNVQFPEANKSEVGISLA